MRTPRRLALALGLAALAAHAAVPTPKDFAHGLLVSEISAEPVQQFTVPPEVYQGVTRADLRDLRVFNGADAVVPHAVCTGPEYTPPSVRELPLLVFPLRQGRPPPPADARVSVRTPSGTSVEVVEAPGSGSSALVATPVAGGADGFVVDASNAAGPLRSLRLAWTTADDASEAQVRVEASEDLNVWRTIVAGTTLLHVAADGAALDRSHIDLPEARYRYLRLVRNEGPAVAIEGVTAHVVEPGTTPAPRRFGAQPAADGGAEGFVFDAGGLAPIHEARVGLTSANMALRVALESRGSVEQPWQLRWTGEVSTVGEGAPDRQNAQFGPVSDTLWRIRVLRGAETLASGRPTLQLAYHPARLRFLAQGEGPFRVGYGSARVPPAETIACDALLPGGDVTLLGAAKVTVAPAAMFGGAEMLVPEPPPTPVRQIVLWAVLLLGTAALVAMALALLRRLREGTTPE